MAHEPTLNFQQRARRRFVIGASALLLAACANIGAGRSGADPLPSWNEGASKQAILKFVDQVTREGSPSYTAPAERIAAFDNDGTLWAEEPVYFQLLFMLDQVRAAAPQHPEWQQNAVFKAIAAGDYASLAAQSEEAILDLLLQANTGMSVEAYDKTLREWLATARHPTLKRPFTELIYQPQLELLAYLRSKGFKTFIVSGGSVEFMRPWAERVYGIPPEQVVGTQAAMKFEMVNGEPVLMRERKIDFLNDGAAKPVGIYKQIGRRPILAFGNSDGDLQMLQYTAAAPGARMALILHHDDAVREFAYDRQSKLAKLDKAWDEAKARGWTVVSMKRDWKQVFPEPKN